MWEREGRQKRKKASISNGYFSAANLIQTHSKKCLLQACIWQGANMYTWVIIRADIVLQKPQNKEI